MHRSMSRLYMEAWIRAWKRDLGAIKEGFSEEVAFKLDPEG